MNPTALYRDTYSDHGDDEHHVRRWLTVSMPAGRGSLKLGGNAQRHVLRDVITGGLGSGFRTLFSMANRTMACSTRTGRIW